MTLARIEVVTTSNMFVGFCEALSGHAPRLLDVLNKDAELFVLQDCKVRSLGDLEEPVQMAKTCFVARNRIVWARPLGWATRARGERSLSVAKEPHSVMAVAPPFRVTGDAHVLPGAEVTVALAQLVQGFFPLTEANVAVGGQPELNKRAPVILLNGRMTDIISTDLASEGAPPLDAEAA